METYDVWTLKTFAFLHDPLHKPLVLGKGHEGIGKDIAKRLCGGSVVVSDEDWEAIQHADRIASGADRSEFLKGLELDPRRDVTFIHPMDGATLARERDGHLEFAEVLLTADDIEEARHVVEGPDFVNSFAAISDARLRYLTLWRFATDVLRAIEGKGGNRFGALYEILPADTRMPTHPVLVHNSLVATLAPLYARGQEPAILRFALGPVQPFIEASRSLADLWAGSYLLSSTVFEAMTVLLEHYGPDSILYPNLRRQPLFDLWLIEQLRSVTTAEPLEQLLNSERERVEDWGLRIPSLPNVFVAIVPLKEAVGRAKECEERCRSYLIKLVREAVSEAFNTDSDTVLGRAERQVRALLEVHWSVVPWPQPLDIAQWLREAWPSRVARDVLEARERARVLEGYRPNAGALYPVVSEQSAILLDAAKRDRLSSAELVEEGGLKCTMCGEREVLGATNFHAQRDLWRQMAQERNKYPWLRENDALCGVCLLKRLVGRKGPKKGRNWRHPSTTEVATSRAKLEIIECCREDEQMKILVTALEQACERLSDREERRVHCVPALLKAASDDAILREFAHLDGEVLLPIKRGDEKWPREVVEAQKDLRKAIAERSIPEPSPYLAVVVFDGDEVGKWLSGEKAPSLLEMLHPKAREQIGQAASNLKGLKRPVTPAFHATMSAICNAFAQVSVPWTIEREGLCGHLVYAGGDDVLFLGPPWDALRLVWRLRLRYSGYPKGIGPDEDPEMPDPSQIRPWFHSRNLRNVLLAFGRDATASAGMCVFHAKDPLGLALERARAAEKRAKEEGRNSLGITILRRSGQESQDVVPFGPAMMGLLDLVRWFASRMVSRSLGVLLQAEFSALYEGAGGSSEDLFRVAEPLARRVVARRLIEDGDTSKLEDLVVSVGRHLLERQVRAGTFLSRWADRVSIAEFIARPHDRGEEERR